MSYGFEIRNGSGQVMLTPDDYSLNIIQAGAVLVPAGTTPSNPGVATVACPGMHPTSARWGLLMPRQHVGRRRTAVVGGQTVIYLQCANSEDAIQYADFIVDAMVTGERLTDAIRFKNYYYSAVLARYAVVREGA